MISLWKVRKNFVNRKEEKQQTTEFSGQNGMSTAQEKQQWQGQIRGERLEIKEQKN